MTEIRTCTKMEAMPVSSEEKWFHPDAKVKAGEPKVHKEGDSQTWACPNCGFEFKVTVGKKISVKEAIRRRTEFLNKLKESGK